MKNTLRCLALLLLLIPLCGCAASEEALQTTPAATVPSTVPVTEPLPTETETVPVPVYHFTEEEQQMLLKIGMAELGSSECTECIALVMRTVLNRVEADRFGSSIRSVLFAPKQFTPVADGSYYRAEPNEYCYDALELVVYGWDESQGALYYEFCEGESWHSKKLHLLFQHCDTRFYTDIQ